MAAVQDVAWKMHRENSTPAGRHLCLTLEQATNTHLVRLECHIHSPSALIYHESLSLASPQQSSANVFSNFGQAPFEQNKVESALSGYAGNDGKSKDIQAYSCDISSPESVNKAFESIASDNVAFPSMLVNAAGKSDQRHIMNGYATYRMIWSRS